MPHKTQVFLIHGGNTFRSQKKYQEFLQTRSISIEKKISWKDGYLDKKLGADFEIISPRMPSPDNAKYSDWKIHFERHFPYLRNNIILIGSSLGGIFLARYLSENTFPKKILATYLVCPPFYNDLPGEELVGGFKLNANITRIQKNSPNLTLLFSKNDDVVPVAHAEKYRKKLPDAEIIIYENKNGHFKVAEFPEIVQMIKNDVKKKK